MPDGEGSWGDLSRCYICGGTAKSGVCRPCFNQHYIDKGGKQKMIDHDEVIKVSESMKKHGGSFVQALGEALQMADSTNRQKIYDTWPTYWKQYKEIAERK